jgi:uncharacterized protein
MQIAIISDSHTSVDKVKKILNHLESINVRYLIHAGDFIGQGIENVLSEFPDITQLIARGNCDHNGHLLDSLNAYDHIQVENVLRFELEEKRFIVAHIPGMAMNALHQESADVVIHGHTHRPRVETIRNTLILNPGSLMEGDGFMILELPGLDVDRRFNF